MRFERLGLFALLLLYLPVSSGAQSWSGLATSRAADWTKAGAGPIPTNRTQCGSTIAAYTGSPSIIANAFNACPAGTYLQLGAGTFNLTGTIFLSNSNVTLRGMGPRSTILNVLSVSPCGESHPAAICVAGGDDSFDGSNPPNISNVTGYSQGSTTIRLGTQTTGSVKPVAGQIIELNMQVDAPSTSSDTWPQIFSCLTSSNGSNNCTNSASGTAADGSPVPWGGPFQLVVVTSISPGACTDASPCTVGITPPIHMPNWGAQPVRGWWQNESSVTGVGIQDLQVTGLSPCIGFRWATYSWARNVEQQNNFAGGSPHYVFLNKTVGITYRDSYLFGQGNWSDEYAVDCYSCYGTLFENNIIEYMRAGFVQEMGGFNVISYNYDVDNASINNIGNEEGGINNHGCCSGYILLEGNDFVNVILDDWYGQSQFTTVLRNRLWGLTPLDVFQNNGYLTPIVISSLSRFSNILGNVLGTPGFHINYQQVGGDSNNTCDYGNQAIYSLGKWLNCGGSSTVPDDSNAAPSTMRWGNWDVVTNAVQWNSSEVPSGLSKYANAVPSGTTLPASFLYSSAPPWWCVSGQTCTPWPAIGPDVSSGKLANSGGFANKIPARVCFEQVMGGSFADAVPRSFDANVCYGTLSSSTLPSPPTGVTVAVK